MRVYLILRVRNMVRVLDIPDIYAFTTSKKIMKKFKKTRNMKVFFIKEIDTTREEYLKFAEKYGERNLSMISLTTKTVTKYGTICKVPVSFIGTFYEEEYCYMRSNDIPKEAVKLTNIYAKFLKKEYLIALERLYYFDFAKFKSNEILNPLYSGFLPDNNEYHGDFEMNIYTDFDLPKSISYDTLSIFYYFFGYTMKVNEDQL